MTASSGPLSAPVVAQYFGFFNGVPKAHYDRIVDAAPFEKCNLLVAAFVHPVPLGGGYVADFTNHRDNAAYPAQPGDLDTDRLRLVIDTARRKNPDLKIVISLGWHPGGDELSQAGSSPGPFADSVAGLINQFGLDGFDIDYESTSISSADLLTLSQAIRKAFGKVTPGRDLLLTMAPAQTDGLTRDVLDCFDYTMPQVYHHGGGGPPAQDYADILGGSYARIVYGLNSEGSIAESDDPTPFAEAAKKTRAAGIMAWRLDNDSLDDQGFPTFATAIKMWELMKG